MSIQEILLLLSIILIFPFFAYACAKKNIFFTFVESGNIKFVMRGSSLHKIIHDVKGYKLEGNEFVYQNENYTEKNWFNSKFGIWWIGLAPFSKILEFRIKKQKENKAGKKVADWISKPEIDIVDSLRFRFPRPYVLTDVELEDRLSVDLLVIPIFEVINPYIPVILLKGDFFDVTGSILESEIIDIVKGKNIQQFITEDKGAVDGILAELKTDEKELNKELSSQVGLKLVSISINKYDPSDATIVEAIQKKAKATAEGEANIEASEQAKKKQKIDAEAYADQLAIRNKADVEAQIALATARGETIKATLDSLKSEGVDPNILARAAADILRTEAVAGDKSKITTWVDGGGASPVIPIKGDGK